MLRDVTDFGILYGQIPGIPSALLHWYIKKTNWFSFTGALPDTDGSEVRTCLPSYK